MQRVVGLTLAVLLCTVAVAKADPVIVVGSYSVSAGTTVVVPVMVYNDTASGNNMGAGITGLNLNAQIYQNADGSGSIAGAPVFVLGTAAVGKPDNSGYVGSPGNPNAGGDVLSGPTVFNVAGHTVPGDGGASTNNSITIAMNFPATTIPTGSANAVLLATLYISTNGVAPGTDWALNLGGGHVVVDADSGDPIKDYGQPGHAEPDNGPTNFGDLEVYNTKIFDGSIHINAVPEPSSIVLGLMAAAGLALVIRRKRA